MDTQLTWERTRHLAVVLAVFAVTGMLALLFSRLVLRGLIGMEGTLIDGPWSYRIVYVLLVPPFYSMTLVAVGTVFGKHTFFKRRVLRMWGRVLPFLPRA